MRFLIAGIVWLLSLTVVPALVSVPSAVDPYILTYGSGELVASNVNSVFGFKNVAGRTTSPSVVSSPSTTAVIITVGQSNIASTAPGTYSVVNSGSDNFNIYDGGIYRCVNPVLGTQYGYLGNSNSANCQIADSLITAGTYTRVIMVPMAVSGTLCSDWVGGALGQRIVVAMARLAARGLTPASGWAGDFWILLHLGETDGSTGTPRATFATCLRALAAAFVTNGATGQMRFFVATESYSAGTTYANATGGQADAVASGCTTCRAGANVDSLVGANRQADTTHLTALGAINEAALDVTVITNCKNTSC